MKRKTKNYTNEFKQEAIKLAMSTGLVSQTAKDLGVPTGTLHTWLYKAKQTREQSVATPDGTVAHVNVGELMAENKSLKTRVQHLEQEKAILKKAATYFAKELG